MVCEAYLAHCSQIRKRVKRLHSYIPVQEIQDDDDLNLLHVQRGRQNQDGVDHEEDSLGNSDSNFFLLVTVATRILVYRATVQTKMMTSWIPSFPFRLRRIVQKASVRTIIRLMTMMSWENIKPERKEVKMPVIIRMVTDVILQLEIAPIPQTAEALVLCE